MADRGGRAGARSPGAERGPRTLTASEAAAVLGVSVATVRAWADRGDLPCHRTVGGHRRFDIDALGNWLSERGGSLPDPRRLARATRELPPCPDLARALNERVETIIERTLAGYDPSVPTPLVPPTEPALRRSALRFVRVVTDALTSGRPTRMLGRAELTGRRGGFGGESGASVIVEQTRLAISVAAEAEAAISEGGVSDENPLPVLHAVIDRVQAAVARGYEQALEERRAAPPPR